MRENIPKFDLKIYPEILKNIFYNPDLSQIFSKYSQNLHKMRTRMEAPSNSIQKIKCDHLIIRTKINNTRLDLVM